MCLAQVSMHASATTTARRCTCHPAAMHALLQSQRAYRSVDLDELGHLLKGMVVALQGLQASLQGPSAQLLEHAPQGAAQISVLSVRQLAAVW